jgi:hypothetical protein
VAVTAGQEEVLSESKGKSQSERAGSNTHTNKHTHTHTSRPERAGATKSFWNAVRTCYRKDASKVSTFIRLRGSESVRVSDVKREEGRREGGERWFLGGKRMLSVVRVATIFLPRIEEDVICRACGDNFLATN